MTNNYPQNSRSTEKREWVTIAVTTHRSDDELLWCVQELTGHTFTDDPTRKWHKAEKFKTRVVLMRYDESGKLSNASVSDD